MDGTGSIKTFQISPYLSQTRLSCLLPLGEVNALPLYKNNQPGSLITDQLGGSSHLDPVVSVKAGYEPVITRLSLLLGDLGSP